MSRWLWKRSALAVVTGLSLSAGSSLSAADKPAASNYQPNDVIVLKSQGRPDQTVTVIRSTRRADGRIHTEVKDALGKTFTMVDDAPNGVVDRVSQVVPAGAKDDLPRAKPREIDAPPASAFAASDSPRKRLFGRDKSESTPAPAPAAEPEKEKKPSFLNRLFSSKKKDEPAQQPQQPQSAPPQGQAYQPPVPTYAPPQGQAYQPPVPTYAPPQPTYGTLTAPATQATPNPYPAVGQPSNRIIPGVPSQMPIAPGTGDLAPWNQVRSPSPAPTVVAPTPPVAMAAPTPPVKAPAPAVTTGTTRINLTPEPPTVKPQGVADPSVTTPSVVAPTVVAPSVVAPSVVAPSVVAPSVTSPSLPAPPGVPSRPSLPLVPVAPPITVPVPPVAIPALPTIPSPSSMTKPANAPGIRTVGYLKTEQRHDVTILDEIKPQVKILRESDSTSERVLAVRCLAGGHYASRLEVKAVLFESARLDPESSVRAQCILELRDLCYFDTMFLDFLQECKNDTNANVREAAVSALAKLSPRK